MTAVPISMRLVRVPDRTEQGEGGAELTGKWGTRKWAPSAPSSSATTTSSIDCNKASDAERVCELGDGDQWPKDRNPIFLTGQFNNCEGLVLSLEAIGHRSDVYRRTD